MLNHLNRVLKQQLSRSKIHIWNMLYFHPSPERTSYSKLIATSVTVALLEASFVSRFLTQFPEDLVAVDLRTLRAIRVLRPLKLVSGIPSK